MSDPFKVLRQHRNYYDDWAVQLDRDVVSTTLYLRAPRGTYDSFIFGNSRSQAFHGDDWRPYLAADAEPFHFDASLESLFGISTKLRFIQARGDSIKNALILLDSTVLVRPDNVQHPVFVKDYRISGQNPLAFQLVFFRGFLANGFYWKYFVHRFTGRIPRITTDVLDTHTFVHLPRTNDLLYRSAEDATSELGEAYFADATRFPPRRANGTPSPMPPIIAQHQLALLCDIRQVLQVHHSRFFVIVPPLYDQRPLAPHDLRLLRAVFGPGHVADFSGRNALTSDVHHFYEYSHFRPMAARAILESLYTSSPVDSTSADRVRGGTDVCAPRN